MVTRPVVLLSFRLYRGRTNFRHCKEKRRLSPMFCHTFSFCLVVRGVKASRRCH